MPTEREAIAKRAAWEAKTRAMTGHYDVQLWGRWKCMATIVTQPCTCFAVVVDGKDVYCSACGEPAPDAARMLGIER